MNHNEMRDLHEELKTLSAREEEAVRNRIAGLVYLTNVDMVPALVASGVYTHKANTAWFDPRGIHSHSRTCATCGTIETTETATANTKQVFLQEELAVKI